MSQIFVWTFSDVIGIVFFGCIALVWVLITASRMWHQFRCKHDGGIGETSACDAICHKCGKNLGFIGNWRNGKRGSS